MTKPTRVSPSQLGMYLRCGEQYRRRYEEGEKIPPGVAMLKGRAVDQAAATNFRQKIQTRQDLDEEELVEKASTEWEAGLRGEGVMLTPEETSRGKNKVLGEQKDRVVWITRTLHGTLAPLIQPALVQERIVMRPSPDLELVGILDLATETKEVRDLKVSGRRKRDADVRNSDQLSWYAASYRARTGELPRKVALDVMVDTGKKVSLQQLEGERTDESIGSLNARVQTFLAGKRAGVYLPAPDGAWNCDPRYCGYFHSCRYVRGRR